MSVENPRNTRERHHPVEDVQKWVEQLMVMEDASQRKDTLLSFLAGDDSIYIKHFSRNNRLSAESSHVLVETLAGMRITQYPSPGEIIQQANGEILALHPDTTLLGSNPQRILYNTLKLAQALPNPNDGTTVGNIETMYRRKKLAGKYKNKDLRKELAYTMMAHQPDTRYKKDWEDMLDQKTSSFIPISHREAFRGIAMMARSKKTIGTPYLAAINPAFVKYAEYTKSYLEGEDAWREEFRWAVHEVLNMYPGRPNWPKDLGRATTLPGWEEWMSEVADRTLWENTRQYIIFPTPKVFYKELEGIILDPTK